MGHLPVHNTFILTFIHEIVTIDNFCILSCFPPEFYDIEQNKVTYFIKNWEPKSESSVIDVDEHLLKVYLIR